MSSKLIITFVMLFFIATLLSGIMEGGGGIAVTSLVTATDEVAPTLTVNSTEGFLASDYVQIENEQIKYTGKTAITFTGCSRGWNATTAEAHSAGTRVNSPDASVLNSVLGFNIASTGETVGSINMYILLKSFFFTAMPKIIAWDYAWLREGWLQYLRIVLMVLGTGFLISVAVTIASALGGILQGIFRAIP